MQDEDLNNLEDWIRRLKIEYEVFFNGNRKKAPDDLKLRVERLIKRLAESGDMTLQQRFRYTTLVSRFYAYRDLWRRTLNERESGISRAVPRLVKQQRPAADEPAQENSIRVSITDPLSEKEKVQQIYDRLFRLGRTAGSDGPAPPFESFVDYIVDRTNKIRADHHCASVEFTVSWEEDAIRFTARAE